MNFPAINLIVLRAEDPAGLASFYEGLGLVFSIERHGSGPEHRASETNGAIFEIYPRSKDGPSSHGTRLGFCVHSISQILEKLSDRASVVSMPKRTSSGLRCILCDPEGHRIELLERA